MQTFHVSFQLLHRRRAQQRAGDERLTADERQRHLRRVEVMAFGNVHIGGDSLPRLLAAVAGKAAKHRIARASRFGAVQVFTG